MLHSSAQTNKVLFQSVCLTCLHFFFGQLNSGKVVAVGPGARDRDGKLIPVTVKEGDTVLLPEYGGTEVKLGEKEYVNLPFMSVTFKLNYFLK